MSIELSPDPVPGTTLRQVISRIENAARKS
jgi:hypothetical protein